MAAKFSLQVILALVVAVNAVLASSGTLYACVQGAQLESRICEKECHDLKEEISQKPACFGDCKKFYDDNLKLCTTGH